MTNFQKVIKIIAICFGVFLIVNIFSVLLLGISILTGYDNENDTKLDSVVETIKNYENITKLDIDISGVNLDLIKSDTFKIELQGTDDRVKINSVGNSLEIEEKFKLFRNHTKSGNIIIHIPSDLNLYNLEIDAGAGKIEIDSLTVKNLELNQGAGIINIYNSNFDKCEIDGGAGNTDIKNTTMNSLDLDAGVGKVEIDAKLLGRSEINCGIGEMNLNLLGGEEIYTIYVDKGIGSIEIDGEKAENNSTYGYGENRIVVNGGIGKIKIGFN